MKALWLSILVALIACNNQREGTNTPSPVDKPDSTANSTQTSNQAISGCYSSIFKRDTADLKVETNGALITGSLSYNLFEKDRNDGTFQGELHDDILSGWYLFKSEGVLSVRQVSWKVKGDQLWQGIGEMIERKDSMVFRNPDNLRYDSTRPFKKVMCVL